MKLNAFETLLMNNPIRAGIQRHYESPLLKRLAGPEADLAGVRALEIGCGRGVGTEIIVERFGAASVDAFDLDPAMVARARERLARFGERVNVDIGDASQIAADDASYGAVFDFGIIHHVPDWRDALDEVSRVLEPGGRFYFEEVTSHALDRWSAKRFFEHPENDRFSGDEFVAALEARGLAVNGNSVERFFGDFVIGVAQRVEKPEQAGSNR